MERTWPFRYLLLAAVLILQLESAYCIVVLEGPAGIPLWQYHGALVTIGFLSLFSGALIASFRPGRWWLRVHRQLALCGVAFTLSGLVVAIYFVSRAAGTHLEYTHSYIGLTVSLFALLTPSLGLAQFRFMAHAKILRPAHRWSGRLLLILMLLNIAAGLKLAGII